VKQETVLISMGLSGAMPKVQVIFRSARTKTKTKTHRKMKTLDKDKNKTITMANIVLCFHSCHYTSKQLTCSIFDLSSFLLALLCSASTLSV
jgi:hypothetical protein